MARLELQGVSKVFPGGVVAVRDVNLCVAEGEWLVLLGPSGCGKTTTLRLIAGLERPTSGEIRLDGQAVNGLPPSRRDVAMVFQSDALYPHLTVQQNLAFGPRLREGIHRGKEWFYRICCPSKARSLAGRRTDIDERVQVTAELLGVEALLSRLPRQLSGGQRQRVALGRAMVRRPAVCLYDEPLSNLDAQLRMETRRELKRIHQELNQTALYVTHDQAEALTLGDRVAVMGQGELQQVGTPWEIYHRPRNRFVAGFVGSPPMNFVDGKSVNGGEEGSPSLTFVAEGWSLPLEAQAASTVSKCPGGRVVLGIRPEAIRRIDGDTKELGLPRLAARVECVEPLGDANIVYMTIGGEKAAKGKSPWIAAKWNTRTEVSAGKDVDVTIEANGLYLFEPTTGANLGLPENG